MASAIAWARGTSVSTSVLLGRVRVAADRRPAQRRTADRRRETGSAPTRELAGNIEARVGSRRLIASEQLLGRWRRRDGRNSPLISSLAIVPGTVAVSMIFCSAAGAGPRCSGLT